MSEYKYELMNTPFGTAQWAHLVTPDKKFNELGDFKVGLVLSAEDARPLIAQIQEVKDKAVVEFTEIEEANKKPGKKAKAVKASDIDPYEELEDGTFEFKLKRKAAYIKDNGERFDFTVPLIDARGVEIKDTSNLNIGNGSEIRARAQLVPYNMATSGVGVSLRLVDCQIRKLVEYTGGSRYDDVSEDGGYVDGAAGASYSDAGAGYTV